MKASIYLSVCVFLALFACHQPGRNQTGSITVPEMKGDSIDTEPFSEQLLIVTTPDWDAVVGQLRRYIWQEGQWMAVGDSIEIRLAPLQYLR